MRMNMWKIKIYVDFEECMSWISRLEIKERKELQKDCIGRESNPGRPRGRRVFYHWTTDATEDCSYTP